ncbi:hypothetical protein GGS24DRAFT_477103 [Hypoxylon argillaceum]|nr:hypothetical protein GGS24DRAFT_477103 [Hypoxylon argillaceum]
MRSLLNKSLLENSRAATLLLGIIEYFVLIYDGLLPLTYQIVIVTGSLYNIVMILAVQ